MSTTSPGRGQPVDVAIHRRVARARPPFPSFSGRAPASHARSRAVTPRSGSYPPAQHARRQLVTPGGAAGVRRPQWPPRVLPRWLPPIATPRRSRADVTRTTSEPASGCRRSGSDRACSWRQWHSDVTAQHAGRSSGKVSFRTVEFELPSPAGRDGDPPADAERSRSLPAWRSASATPSRAPPAVSSPRVSPLSPRRNALRIERRRPNLVPPKPRRSGHAPVSALPPAPSASNRRFDRRPQFGPSSMRGGAPTSAHREPAQVGDVL